jgi:GH25 family lysozyme M1 (1,4-beta-N-acetylmuramidase)
MHASKGLSTKSRGDICDRLDEAKSVREVELIAKSLMEAVKRHLSSAKPKGTTALAESVNRATATKTFLKPSKKEVEAIVEGVDLARWNQLAGIVND